jgi:hypothetical protein
MAEFFPSKLLTGTVDILFDPGVLAGLAAIHLSNHFPIAFATIKISTNRNSPLGAYSKLIDI